MAYRIFDNPYSAQPGLSPEGRTCILILDENGKPTGRYCYNTSSIAKIIGKLEKAEAEEQKRPKRLQPEAMAEVMPEAEYLYTAGDVPRFGFQFSRHLTRRADQEVFAKPLLRDIQTSAVPSQDYRYSAADAARLLDRKDAQSAKYALTLFLRLFERQDDDEQRAGTAKYLNQRGFNAIDSKAATSLVKYLLDHDFVTQDAKGFYIPTKKVLPVGIHLRVADILSGYLVQVVDIMNEGAARTGKMVRTNPRRRAKSRR